MFLMVEIYTKFWKYSLSNISSGKMYISWNFSKNNKL